MIEDNIILLGKVGSHAYGTNVEDSDLDYKGIVIPPVNYFLGLKSFEGYDNTGGKNFKNTKEDVDMTLIHVTKFIKDAMKGVPNNLELLFLERNDYDYLNSYGQDLINFRNNFLSKQVFYKFGGYAKSQASKLKNLKNAGNNRKDLVGEYGYDTKSYMHTVRLLESAIEILEDGYLLVKRPNAKELVELRNGKHTLYEALHNIDRLEIELTEAFNNSLLPDTVDNDLISEFLVDLNCSYLKLSK